MVRTIIEAIVLISGLALGGLVGLGTVLFAVAIGPIAHQAIPSSRGSHHFEQRIGQAVILEYRQDIQQLRGRTGNLDDVVALSKRLTTSARWPRTRRSA